MLDMHVHVWPHERGTPVPTFELLEQYCEAAAAKGIDQLAITEHCYRFTRIADQVLPHWDRPASGALADATDHVLDVESGGDLDAYVTALVQAKDAGLPLLVGLEVDYLPGAMSAMAAVLDDYPFDVLLGSVHWLDDWLFDAYGNEVFGGEWQRRDLDEVFAQYVDSILELAGSGVIDVLAHLDVIKVAGYLAPDLAQYENRLVEGLAACDVAIELSSAGLHKPCEQLYPSPSLLQSILAAGLPITTASDAHTFDRVGADYDAVRATLAAHGVTDLATFDRRQRISHPI